MCTAISLTLDSHFFGRTLDYETGFGEEVTVTPRNFPLVFRHAPGIHSHFALIGMAKMVDAVPLYFDGMNEYGLCMAGLNFPGFAVYQPCRENAVNIAPFELIPWVLGQCKTVAEAKKLLSKINLVNIPFSEELPLSPLHWMVADQNESIVIEPMADGLHILDNPVGVMTNSPPLDYHLLHLSQFSNLSSRQPSDPLAPLYSRGMGAIGLPGDYSSASRFVRAAFLRKQATPDAQTATSFFHLLDAVSIPKGAVLLEDGRPVITQYACCMDAGRGIYYYTTYHDRQIKSSCF